MKKNISKWSARSLVILSIFGLVVVGCSKNNPEPLLPEEPPVSEEMFNKLISVKNFGEDLPTDSKPTTEQEPIYFSLEQNQPVKIDYRRTNRWDISFSGIYRGFIGGNNGNNKDNFGFGGPASGGIYIVEKKFDEVTQVPDDALFRTRSAAYGTDDEGDLGEGIGWFLYDFPGTIVGDGSYDMQHVAYAMENRTVIIRTAKGNYAKIKMQSIYKDKLDPKAWRRNDPKPFFSFQYILVKAGSKTFEITK